MTKNFQTDPKCVPGQENLEKQYEEILRVSWLVFACVCYFSQLSDENSKIGVSWFIKKQRRTGSNGPYSSLQLKTYQYAKVGRCHEVPRHFPIATPRVLSCVGQLNLCPAHQESKAERLALLI